MEEKKSNKKFWGYLILALLSIVLCYLFVVLYFFYIDTCNISAKFLLWPFLSEEAKSEQFLSATVDISFDVEDKDHQTSTINIVGVNMHKDGYVVTTYDQLRDFVESNDDSAKIIVRPNSGQTLTGKVLFGDINFNLAIIKCESPNGESVKMPYLKLPLEQLAKGQEYYAISSPLDKVSSHKIRLTTQTKVYEEISVSNYTVVDFCMQNCWQMNVLTSQDFEDAVVVSGDARFMGFAFQVETSTGSVYAMMDGKAISSVLDKVVEKDKEGKLDGLYRSSLVQSVHGYDGQEYQIFNKVSSQTDGFLQGFFFEGKMETYPDSKVYDSFWYLNMPGFFLFKDFSYNQQKIEMGNVVTAIQIDNKEKIEITKTPDLFEKLYQLEEGQSLKIFFKSSAVSNVDGDEIDENNITLTV